MNKRMAVSDAHASILLALANHPAKPPIAVVCSWARMIFEERGLSDCSETTLRRHIKRMEHVPSQLLQA